jgi:hypothetical protein
MKKLYILSCSLVLSTVLKAQCVEMDRFFTGGLHYLATKKASGFQLEIGSTGSESNVSYYAMVTAFSPKANYKDTTSRAFPQMVFGMKFAYRLVRVENVLQLSITTAMGADMIQGFYNANSIKLLTALGGKVALSIEPSYLARQKAFVMQAGVNIILD